MVLCNNKITDVDQWKLNEINAIKWSMQIRKKICYVVGVMRCLISIELDCKLYKIERLP